MSSLTTNGQKTADPEIWTSLSHTFFVFFLPCSLHHPQSGWRWWRPQAETRWSNKAVLFTSSVTRAFRSLYFFPSLCTLVLSGILIIGLPFFFSQQREHSYVWSLRLRSHNALWIDQASWRGQNRDHNAESLLLTGCWPSWLWLGLLQCTQTMGTCVKNHFEMMKQLTQPGPGASLWQLTLNPYDYFRPCWVVAG